MPKAKAAFKGGLRGSLPVVIAAGPKKPYA